MSFKHTTFTVNNTSKRDVSNSNILYSLQHYRVELFREQHKDDVTVRDLLQRVWRPNDKDFPSVEIIIVNQACWESLHWVFV